MHSESWVYAVTYVVWRRYVLLSQLHQIRPDQTVFVGCRAFLLRKELLYDDWNCEVV